MFRDIMERARRRTESATAPVFKRLRHAVEALALDLSNLARGASSCGIKRSGYGRELSRLGIQEFVNRKLVRVYPAGAYSDAR